MPTAEVRAQGQLNSGVEVLEWKWGSMCKCGRGRFLSLASARLRQKLQKGHDSFRYVTWESDSDSVELSQGRQPSSERF